MVPIPGFLTAPSVTIQIISLGLRRVLGAMCILKCSSKVVRPCNGFCWTVDQLLCRHWAKRKGERTVGINLSRTLLAPIKDRVRSVSVSGR